MHAKLLLYYSTILILNIWTVDMTDPRKQTRRQRKQLPLEWLEYSKPLPSNISSVTDAPEVERTTLNSTYIQQQVRKNMIKAASGSSAVNLPNFHYVKKEFCKSEPLTQIVKERGCRPSKVRSRYCYGQCNSFFIPKNIRRKSSGSVEKSSFKSCSFCRPRTFDWISVRLHCPNDRSKYRIKNVQIVRECSCMALRVK